MKRIVKCKLKGVSPLTQGRYHQVEKKEGELDGDYEKRTWKEKCYYNNEGEVVLPPMVFANSLKEAAKFLSIAIPGKGQSKFTKNFDAGVMVYNPSIIEPIATRDNIEECWVHVPSDGTRGGKKRVSKCFPLILQWEVTVTYYVFDDIITEEVFEKVLRASGELIGIGTFRPINRGYHGRFIVEEIKWET